MNYVSQSLIIISVFPFCFVFTFKYPFLVNKAPSNMKSVLQAGWLLTNSFGNFIVLIVAEIAKLPKQVKKKKEYNIYNTSNI